MARAHELGLEVALDIALQCSPDHPWVTEHPNWFTTRVDGTIAFAENPPKKYQDIYPLNFDNDPEGIYQEIKRILELWVSHGVTLFRVDNPHTKPVAFWQRILAEFREKHPEVIFLAEAFTNPPMMQTLGTVGFSSPTPISPGVMNARKSKNTSMKFPMNRHTGYVRHFGQQLTTFSLRTCNAAAYQPSQYALS